MPRGTGPSPSSTVRSQVGIGVLRFLSRVPEAWPEAMRRERSVATPVAAKPVSAITAPKRGCAGRKFKNDRLLRPRRTTTRLEGESWEGSKASV